MHFLEITLQWRHDARGSVSNHRRFDCLLKRLLRRRSKKTFKPCGNGLCEGNPPVTGASPSQRASNAENVSIWWCDHDISPVQITLDLIFPTRSMLFLGVSMTVTHTKSYWYWFDHKMSLRFVMANVPLHCYTTRSISLFWLHGCFYLGNLE